MWRVIFIAAICISSVFPFTNAFRCPRGFRQEGSKCRQLHDGEMGCPRGLAGQCVITKKYCSSTEVKGSIDNLAPTSSCQNGFTLDAVNGVCVKDGYSGRSCPSSCSRVNGECVSLSETQGLCRNEKRPGCQVSSYELKDGETCTSLYSEGGRKCYLKGDIYHICLTGNYDPVIGFCKARCSIKTNCPNGDLNNNECGEDTEMAPQLTCPLDNRQRPLPIRVRCLQGAGFKDGCQGTEIVQPVLLCPPNFRKVRNGRGCESFDYAEDTTLSSTTTRMLTKPTRSNL